MVKMMKAGVLHRPGGPDAIKLEQRPVPLPGPDEVLVRIKAFGLNRSELFTRQGHSPNVLLPRILGIEAVGEVVDSPSGQFQNGDTVATAMGGLGRQFDGSYAEYCTVPAPQVQQLETDLPWEILGALPEMLQTAWGSLFTTLQLKATDRLLIRGGTTSVGLAAAAIAKKHGAWVAATTRNPDSEAMLLENGADAVVIDGGKVAQDIRVVHPDGVDKVLELVGTTTLLDSLQATAPKGIVCMTGMVGDKWSFDEFSPMDVIPTAVSLSTYSGGSEDFMQTPLQQLIDQVGSGEMRIKTGPRFYLDEIVRAHEVMETNQAAGKIVVLP